MKQYRASAILSILVLILFSSPHPALADQHSRALASPASPGIESASTRPERTAVARKQSHPALPAAAVVDTGRRRDVAMLSPDKSGDERGLQWHYQAAVQVEKPGLIETVLPAGVFFGTDNAARTSQLDLTLVGPDGNPRSFELFWKGDTGPRESLAWLSHCTIADIIA